jgi:hypothetical protein
MITGIVGGLGSGKTATLTFMGLMYHAQGFKLYSNYNISFGGSPLSECVYSNDDLDRVKDGYFLGDELWSWVDSRMSSSHANKFVSNILLRSRKRGFNLIYTAQNFHQIDKRIRDITDYIILPVSFIRKDDMDIKIRQSILKPISLKPYLPYTFIGAFVLDADFERVVDTFTFKLEPITKIYDTSEEVEELATSEVKKGIIFENDFKMELEKCYPDCSVKLLPNSGLHQDSFDVELKCKSKLHIFDLCTLIQKEYKGKMYFYLNLNHKNANKYTEIRKKRNANTYFAFMYGGVFNVVHTGIVWDLTGKSTISLNKLLPHVQKIDFLLQ